VEFLYGLAKIINKNNRVIFCCYQKIGKFHRSVPPPSGRGLGGGRDREHQNSMKNTPPKKLKLPRARGGCPSLNRETLYIALRLK